jgi:hypothetical protein
MTVGFNSVAVKLSSEHSKAEIHKYRNIPQLLDKGRKSRKSAKYNQMNCIYTNYYYYLKIMRKINMVINFTHTLFLVQNSMFVSIGFRVPENAQFRAGTWISERAILFSKHVPGAVGPWSSLHTLFQYWRRSRTSSLRTDLSHSTTTLPGTSTCTQWKYTSVEN